MSDIKKKSLVLSLMLATFLAAIEGTVVTTAIPTIVRDLQGFELISLVFSVYLLTSAISTPICGKLADLYGRKNILAIGIIIFLAGSVLCGLAQSMYMLIGFRAIQGLGAGSIFTITMTIVGDVFALEERSKVQGSLSLVWGVAGLAGPFLGGILIDLLSWHWIFFINVPFGLLAVLLLQRSLKEDLIKKKQPIDYPGIITLSVAMFIFINLFLTGENSRSSAFTIISLVATFLFLFLFYIVERKAQEPIMPFAIFTRTSAIVNSISFLASVVLISVDVYLPVYIQNILGYGPTVSGLAMLPMSLSWLIVSYMLGKLILKHGGKTVTIASNVALLLGLMLLPILGVDSLLILVILFSFTLGFGFGGVFTTMTIIVQESVDYNQRGVAVAANSLFRIIGQTIGISVFGSVFNLSITKFFLGLGIKGIDPSNLYNSSVQSNVVTPELIKLSLNSSMHVLFLLFILLAVAALVLGLLMPQEK
ncbi:MAG TPA: MFS transporter [Peptococcaceae bacterium]|nr:MFS transporter [Peptococcaceae bacterium]